MATRTTISLDDDVLAAVKRLRRIRSIGLSQAVNELVRAGLSQRIATPRFKQSSRSLGSRVDVTNVADALELVEGPSRR
jgi:Arc/MetJ family transcription regulator